MNTQLDYINDLLEKDSELRDKIRDEVHDLDKKTRVMAGILNKLHSTPPDKVAPLLDSVRPIIQSCQKNSSALAEIIPPNQFWRWKDMWSFSLRNAIFSAALVEYMTSRTLISLEQVSATLGIDDAWKDKFALTAEDYLHALITLVNELSRLAVNSVTMGDFDEPLKISTFVKDVFAGFSMLNLKNDTLRRRYDSLKYDLKKIEEVVYDISLRNLHGAKAQEVTPDPTKSSE
ncbi:translin [Thelephora terrestris]|uniref:Translin n=1 Tax=Thelephora terrestris TaxID=56493 RepID=A0A9P6HBL3_9AGAM|nr:translin [Thelephora terrestris]